VDAILVNDESKYTYLALSGQVDRLFRAVQPDPAINAFRPMRTVFWVLTAKIRSLVPKADITQVMADIERLLDQAIDARPLMIGDEPGQYDASRVIDLSNIDFDALRAVFERGRKHTEAEKLKGQIAAKLAQMVELNRQRIDYLERFQALIDEYNSGSANIQTFFDKLLEFTQELSNEEKRHIAEQLTEEELAIFDLLTRPEPKLTKAEEQEVKKVAQDLLATLKAEKLVLDWRKRQQSRAAVWVAIEEYLDKLPTDPYPAPVYAAKCNTVYQHVYDAYQDADHSVYA
jgi:type I restriction enzyme R subunit